MTDRYAGGIDIPAKPPAVRGAAAPRRGASRRPPAPPRDDDDAIGEVAAAGEERHRYAGGVGLGDDPGTSTPVAAPTVDLPKVVRKYLLPTESDRNIICIREHWAALGTQLAILAGALLFAVAANSLLYEAHKATLLAVRIVWLPFGLALLWYAFHAASWYTRWIVVTPQRIMTVGGLVKRNVVPLPMKRARDSELSINLPGRLLGYGTIKTQSFGTEHQLSAIRFVPDVDAVFNAIWGILLPGEGGVMPGSDDL